MEIIYMLVILAVSVLCGMETVCAWDKWKGRKALFHTVWTRKLLYLSSAFWAASGLSLYYLYGRSLNPIRYLTLFLTYGILTPVDMRRKEVPDGILLCFLSAELLLSASSERVEVWGIRAGTGILFAAAVLLLCRLSNEGLGMGDAKLLGATAISAGWQYTLLLIFYSLVPAFLFSLGLLVFGRRNMKAEFPYVPFLTAGLAIQMAFTFIT